MKQNYNNESLARLGHGKWKSALGHTLLIIGMVLMSMGVFAQAPTGGLYMNKDWQPDPTDPTGSRGNIRLETFVTGEKIITESHIPTDIVVVLDQSGSMAEYMGSKTRLQALKDALGVFIDSIQADANRYGCDHRMAIVGFATGNLYNNGTYFENTEILSTASVIPYRSDAGENPNISDANYRDALVHVTTSNNNNVNSRLTTATGRLAASGGTEMQYGLRLAYEILNKRDTTQFNAGTEANPKMMDRSQVVVFFTDGYPGLDFPSQGNSGDRFAQYNPDYYYANTYYIAQTTADATVIQARNIKNLPHGGAKVFSVGVFDGANPTAAYTTTTKAYRGQNGNGTVRYYYWEPQTLPSGQNSGDAAANGLMHFISSEYSATETAGTTPWSTLTVSNDGRSGDYYYSASTPEDLAKIFTAIAQESGGSAVPMGEGTIVQDVISPSFQLNIPEGLEANQAIKAYAPKCTGKDANGSFTFDPETEGTVGRLILNENGVVQDVEGRENRLPDGIVNYDSISKTITFSNFNFEEMFVAQEKDNQGHLIEGQFTGRKLVMLIPLEVGGGSWGDGIETNGPLSVIKPNGDTVQANWLAFNRPTANVLGSVWTEVVRFKPEGFDANNIDSPEDLAWFISEVNGRIGYNQHTGENDNNTVASHPKLNGRLTADIDMSAHNWVPIGCGWQVEIGSDGKTKYVEENGQKVPMRYEGTFDGNGHVITGLKNNASKYYKQITGGSNAGVVVFPGMFSDVKGTVKNVFVLDADFRGKHHNANFVHHGIIADTLEAGGNIFNCEAAGRITCNNDDVANDSQLIYGGLVGLNKGGTIHSSMAVAELTAYTMGGLVGENRGTVTNSFTNGVYNYLDNGVTPAKYVGGLVGDNSQSTKLENCYVRFERNNQNLNKAVFGQITGTANTTYTKCYSPEDLAGKVPTGSTPGTNTYKNAEPAQWIRPFYHDATLGDTRTALLDQLNADKGSGASWKRTTAGGYLRSPNGGNINGDYPVLQFDTFGEDAVTCLGSADGIRIDYATSLKEMLHRHNNGNMNENTQIDNEFTDANEDYYKVSGHAAIYKGTINLYANDDVTLQTTGGKDGVADNCTAEGVVVYIDEKVSLLQDDSSVIKGFTGQNMKVFGGDYTDYLSGNRWHNVSSSLENSGFGWTYTNTGQVPHSTVANPCGWRLDQTNDDVDIFPTDLGTYHQTDFYCFYEPQYHWINFRRNGKSHWHMDLINDAIGYDEPTNHAHIDYVNELGVHDNETQFIPGKGYLLAINPLVFDSVQRKETQWLQNYGTLNHTDITIPVSYTAANEWTGLAGYNLLGNPYQSFLDFDAFVSQNATLLGNSNFANTYAVYDPNEGNYVQYKSGSSKGSRAAGQYINMHQGFFIQVNATGTATFTNAMRSNSGTPNFRGEQPAYPLINFIVKDNEGNTDLAILECNRPENDGAKKLRTGNAAGRIYFRYDNENLAIYFRNSDKDYQTLNFAAEEDGNFTLSWERANDNFRTLTLVDNITGIKTDMLTHDHYTFEGRVDDYNTRFKIVFGEMDTNEEEPVLEHFAFFDHGNLIVNGTGHFEVVDVLGRVVYATELTDTQNTVSLPSNVRGVCMLCFTRNNETKVQKMVIQ
jgi:hypothetical protein